MFNIFKTKIPIDNAQEVTEVESFTVKWEIQGDGYSKRLTYHKVFVSDIDAIEFERQLRESAKFIKAYINTEKYKN